MNLTAIIIMAIACWALVEIVQAATKSKANKRDNINKQQYEADISELKERIATLERIVTDDGYELKRQFKDLENDKVA